MALRGLGRKSLVLFYMRFSVFSTENASSSMLISKELMGRGIHVAAMPQMTQWRTTEPTAVGLQHPQMLAPNPHSTRLSDMTISTIMLNWHKTGSAVGMLWAGECEDPKIRQYHVNGANLCQEMAYETWQYMNTKGYYQAPQLADHTMNTMINAYQPQAQQQQQPVLF
ncbi:MAG: spore coat protein [Brevibacillus sp.]|nr:spore coat protein [Brevibacillus sp.]